MTRDEKQLLRALGTLFAFKVVLYMSIHYAAKAAREAATKYEPDYGLTGQFTRKTGTDQLAGHVECFFPGDE